MLKITSLDNQRIKDIVKLVDRKERNETGLTVIDGIREVTRAFEAGAQLTEIYVCPEYFETKGDQGFLARLTAKDIPIAEITREVFHKIAFGDRREGIVAVCRPEPKQLADLKLSKKPLVVVVENVEKPGNLGAIVRTCDGAAVDALLVADSRTDIYNPNVIRSSLGAVFSVPIVQGAGEEILQFLLDNEIKVVATSPAGEKVYANANLREPVAIVVGSEQEGLNDFWMRHSHAQVRIPMHGRADSLNVSITTAIIIYEALRQREADNPDNPPSVPE